ncbi:unnamed protein product [Clonostachys chloroleuca]|uniref:Uncharacterized protein n=1 Tax=Clonostachys chloroleuca TaxID=1926264 RepID=A0AA35PV74_9HYPO|nr:unnamed protein product [Clonostachys chloroleuca]
MDVNPYPEARRYHLTEDLSDIVVMSDPDTRLYAAMNHALPKRASGIGSLVTFHEFGIAEIIVNSKPDGCFSPAGMARGVNRDSWHYEAVMIR